MFVKMIFFVVFLAGVSALPFGRPALFVINEANLMTDDFGNIYLKHPQDSIYPVYNRRVRRQVHGALNTNSDGSTNIMAKLPLSDGDNYGLSAIGGLSGSNQGDGYGSAYGGLALDSVNGHSLSLTGKHIPSFGDQLTASGKVNLFQNENHDLSGNVFGTRSFPSDPVIPNFSTVGGGLDYMYKSKVGGSLGMSYTDLNQRTDYSAMGKLNLFSNPTSSLDLNAGFTKSTSPFMSSSSWSPSAGLSFTKYF